MLVAPIKQGEGAIEHESPTGLIRFHQHGWRLYSELFMDVDIPILLSNPHASWQCKYKLDLVVQQ